MTRDVLRRLLRAWLLTAALDGLFASAMRVFPLPSTVGRLWQGVAATLLGPAAFEGGVRTVLLGLLMHLGVALGWTTVFVALVTSWPWLRRVVAAPGGVLRVAVVYGPLVWLVMSCVVIPRLTGHAPTFAWRWWVQLFGHIPFVALPIVAMSVQSRNDPSGAGATDVAAARSMSQR